MLEKYPQDVKLVFKNFPLRNHTYARHAAAAALAAEKQGKFWEFHDLLYKNYNRLNPQKIKEISQAVGLDEEKFAKDMKSPSVLAAISRDMSEGARAGVRGTPTVFLNGRLLRDWTLKGLQAAIERERGKVSK